MTKFYSSKYLFALLCQDGWIDHMTIQSSYDKVLENVFKGDTNKMQESGHTIIRIKISIHIEEI